MEVTLDPQDIATRLDRILETVSRTDGRVDVLHPRVEKIGEDVSAMRERMAVVEERTETGKPIPPPATVPAKSTEEDTESPRGLRASVPPIVWQALAGLLLSAGSALATWAATHNGSAAATSPRPADTSTASAPHGSIIFTDGGTFTAGSP